MEEAQTYLSDCNEALALSKQDKADKEATLQPLQAEAVKKQTTYDKEKDLLDVLEGLKAKEQDAQKAYEAAKEASAVATPEEIEAAQQRVEQVKKVYEESVAILQSYQKQARYCSATIDGASNIDGCLTGRPVPHFGTKSF